jgi:Protein of unknown function (DUF2840)
MPDEINNRRQFERSAQARATEIPGNSVRTSVTTVHTAFHEGHHNYRVLFGTPLRIDILRQKDEFTRRIYSFELGSRFGLDLWRRKAHGIIQWRCFVCEAVGSGPDLETIPFVTPGARVLLHTKGAAQSRLFLAWLADLDNQGVDVRNCPAETFEAAHFRLHGSRADSTPPRTLSGRI